MKVSPNKSRAVSSSRGPAAGSKQGKAGQKKPTDVFDQALKNSKGLSDQQVLKQQKQLQEHSEQMQLKSNVIAMKYDLMKSMIQNIHF